MDEFLIQSAENGAQLLFFDRTPPDRDQPIEGYWVRITSLNLSAAGSVYAGYANSHPASLFADMAQQWQGWPGELEWRSLEYEFALRCTHDRRGHIRIGVQLGARMGHWQFSWQVQAAIMAEAGQLERLARQAAAFFGQPRHAESNTRRREARMPQVLHSERRPLPFAYSWLVRQGAARLGNWYFINDQLESDLFRQEFIRETAAPNDAVAKDFQPFIRHGARDDFAGFIIREGRVTTEVVLVHLTFAGRPELPGFPNMTVYEDIWEWLDDCVDVDEDRRLVERLREQFHCESHGQ